MCSFYMKGYVMDDLIPSYMTQAKSETTKEYGGAEAICRSYGSFMAFGVVRWWLLLPTMQGKKLWWCLVYSQDRLSKLERRVARGDHMGCSSLLVT